MFGEVIVPRNCRAVVNQRIEDRTRFHVGRHVPVYFVDFTPVFRDVNTLARCKEGIEHRIALTVRFAFQIDNIARILEDQGHADRSKPLTVKVEDSVKSQSAVDVVKAVASRYVRETAFFDLAKPEQVSQDLEQRIQAASSKAKLVGELVSCEVTHTMPKGEELAELAAAIAAAGFESVAKYFREAKTQIETVRADVKIAALNEQERIKARQAQLDDLDATRKETAQKRNSLILESGAKLDFDFDMKRLEDKKQIATKELELAEPKEAEEAAARERRRLDLQVDLEAEQARAKIRVDEKAAILGQLDKMFGSVAAIPAPDYSQVRTLVAAGNSATESPRDLFGGLLWALLTKTAELQPSEDQKK